MNSVNVGLREKTRTVRSEESEEGGEGGRAYVASADDFRRSTSASSASRTEKPTKSVTTEVPQKNKRLQFATT